MTTGLHGSRRDGGRHVEGVDGTDGGSRDFVWTLEPPQVAELARQTIMVRISNLKRQSLRLI